MEQNNMTRNDLLEVIKKQKEIIENLGIINDNNKLIIGRLQSLMDLKERRINILKDEIKVLKVKEEISYFRGRFDVIKEYFDMVGKPLETSFELWINQYLLEEYFKEGTDENNIQT